MSPDDKSLSRAADASAHTYSPASGQIEGVSQDQSTTGRRQAWRQTGVAFAAFFGLLTIVMFGTASQIVSIWYNSATFNHGFLIPVISGWLIWEQRESLAMATPRPDPRFLLPLAGAGGLWFFGWLGDLALLQHAAFVFAVQLSIPLFFGWPITRAVLFPIVYLVFCVPFGDELVPPLQDFTASFTVKALRLTGVPVYWEGHLLSVAVESGIANFRVAEACAGVRYLIAGVALGTLFAHLCFKSWRRRALVLLLSVVVPILANGVRAYGIVMIAYLSDLEHAVGIDHLIYGWVFFTVVIVLLVAAALPFSDKPISAVEKKDITDSNRPMATPARLAGLAFAGLVLAGGAGAWASLVTAPERMAASLDLPVALQTPWRATDAERWPLAPWQPRFNNADATATRVFQNVDGQSVLVHLAAYVPQRAGAELVQYGNLIEGAGEAEWTFNGQRLYQIQTDAGPLKVVEIDLALGNNQRILVWRLYRINESLIARDVETKLAGLLAKLQGNLSATALVLGTPTGLDREEARERLQSVVSGLPDLNDLMTPAVE